LKKNSSPVKASNEPFGANRLLPSGIALNPKEQIMRTDWLKSSVYGAFGGAVALAMVGFGWGGWVTSGSAELAAKTRSENAVVAALAPICATQFQKAPDAAAQQAVLVTKGSWEQKKLVEAAGWAQMPGSTEVAAGVANACANLIAKLKL
jgi:alpha/beta superfamily hydrolase